MADWRLDTYKGLLQQQQAGTLPADKAAALDRERARGNLKDLDAQLATPTTTPTTTSMPATQAPTTTTPTSSTTTTTSFGGPQRIPPPGGGGAAAGGGASFGGPQRDTGTVEPARPFIDALAARMGVAPDELVRVALSPITAPSIMGAKDPMAATMQTGKDVLALSGAPGAAAGAGAEAGLQ